MLLGAGLAPGWTALLVEWLWHAPQRGPVAVVLGIAVTMALLAASFTRAVAPQMCAAIDRASAWLTPALGLGWAAAVYALVRGIEPFRSWVSTAFVLPPAIFDVVVIAPLAILAALGVLVALIPLRVASAGAAPGLGGAPALLCLLAGALVSTFAIGEMHRASTWVSLGTLLTATALGVLRPIDLTPLWSVAPRSRIAGLAALIIALPVAGAVVTAAASQLAHVTAPAQAAGPVMWLFAGATMGAALLAISSRRGHVPATLLTTIAALAIAVVIWQFEHAGARWMAIGVAIGAAAGGFARMFQSMGSLAALAPWAVLAGVAFVLPRVGSLTALPVESPRETASNAGELSRWAELANVRLTPRARELEYGSLEDVHGNWWMDRTGPQYDALVLQGNPMPFTDSGDARRLVLRALSSLRQGGRLVVALPAEGIVGPLIRYGSRGDENQTSLFLVLAPNTPSAPPAALVFGPDVPAWLLHATGGEVELKVYPVRSRAQLLSLLAAEQIGL